MSARIWSTLTWSRLALLAVAIAYDAAMHGANGCDPQDRRWLELAPPLIVAQLASAALSLVLVVVALVRRGVARAAGEAGLMLASLAASPLEAFVGIPDIRVCQ